MTTKRNRAAWRNGGYGKRVKCKFVQVSFRLTLFTRNVSYNIMCLKGMKTKKGDKKMSYYYVDYENVNKSGLNGIAKLSSDDVVKIFYSKDAETMTFGLHRRICDSKAQFEYCRIDNTIKESVKNALDILLLKDLAEVIKENRNDEYYIISKDSDYDKFILQNQKKNVKIFKLEEICKKQVVKEISAEGRKKQIFCSFFSKCMKEKYGDYKEQIIEAYMTAKSRQELNNLLQRTFYNENVREILLMMKDYIKDLPGR